jgi:hypothetical protein
LLLIVHSYLRWLVLIAGAIAVGKLWGTAVRGAPYGPAEKRVSQIFIGLFDLQFLLGLILYATSPLVKTAMQNTATSMQDPHTRFIVAEHPLMMFIALCVAHGASIWSRKAPTDRQKLLRGEWGFALAIGLMLAGIPWFRMYGA